jgi:predicted AAA+ superfamily ATPase
MKYSISDYIVWGGFPASLAQDDVAAKRRYLTDLNDTIVYNDLENRYKIRKKESSSTMRCHKTRKSPSISKTNCRSDCRKNKRQSAIPSTSLFHNSFLLHSEKLYQKTFRHIKGILPQAYAL